MTAPAQFRQHQVMILTLCLGALAQLLADVVATDGESAGAPPAWSGVERVGQPVIYSFNVDRFRFGTTDVRNPAFYPIPQDAVTRDTCLRCLEEMKPADIARNPNHGMDGARAFMPVLVKYVQTGNATWAEACIAMLKAFHAEMERQVVERKWFWQSEHPAALIPLYHKYLLQGGAMKEDADWFREMWLCYCRHLHVWDTEPVEWRGGCHRSMPEALSKGLAAKWYPDIPEAAHWERYSELVFGDFWKAKDVAQNDTGYMMGPIIILTCGGDQWTGDDRVYRDPDMKRLWDRLMVEATPDGAINPYGPNGVGTARRIIASPYSNASPLRPATAAIVLPRTNSSTICATNRASRTRAPTTWTMEAPGSSRWPGSSPMTR